MAAPSPEAEPAPLEFEHVSLAFGETPALLDVSFRVHRGETKVLLGEAGAGKSVALKLAIGLLRPDAGRVVVLGELVSGMPERQLFQLRRRIGIVFQESALFDSLTVRENVAYRLVEERNLASEAIEERVRYCLRQVEMEAAIDKFPAELSGGMQRRVAIARALATAPEILLYDSPTAGLDPITAANIMEQIIKLRDLNHVSALLVTHRLQDGVQLATQRWDAEQNSLQPVPAGESPTSFLVLHEHRVLFDGSALELRASSNSYLRDFLHLQPA